jgi:hypothetical protein
MDHHRRTLSTLYCETNDDEAVAIRRYENKTMIVEQNNQEIIIYSNSKPVATHRVPVLLRSLFNVDSSFMPLLSRRSSLWHRSYFVSDNILLCKSSINIKFKYTTINHGGRSKYNNIHHIWGEEKWYDKCGDRAGGVAYWMGIEKDTTK